jgi:hypothetical protein
MAEPQSQEQLPVEWVTKDIIRQNFNNGQFYEKAKSGELSTYIKRSSHPGEPPSGEPVCTWSQIVYYYDRDSKPVAVVHQYLRPDGTIGASGLPDPKRLFLKDRIISVRSDE